MKKVVSIVLAGVLMLALAACGGSGEKDPIVGTWQLDSVVMLGESMSVDEYGEMMGEDFSKGVTMEFKAGGKQTTKIGSTMDNQGTWTNEDGKYTVSDYDDMGADVTVTVEGDTLTIDVYMVLQMVFTRK